jgi:hypothetical protein
MDLPLGVIVALVLTAIAYVAAALYYEDWMHPHALVIAAVALGIVAGGLWLWGESLDPQATYAAQWAESQPPSQSYAYTGQGSDESTEEYNYY